MSTALGRPRRPDTDIHHLIIFIVLSVIIHLGVVMGLFSYAPYAERLMKIVSPRKDQPVEVDVVDLPPLPPGVRAKTNFKRPPTHFANRTQSVEKETYPAAPKVGPYHPASPGISIPPRVSGGGARSASRPAQKAAAPAENPAAGKNAGSFEGASKAGDIAIKGITGPGESNHANAGTHAKAAGKGAAKNGRKPNLFLSNDQIANLEKRYEAESPKGEQGKTLQLNTSEFKYQRYLLAMKDAIERRWDYPAMAAANGWQGILRIDFTINKDGTIRNIKVLKSSDYPVLDDAAVTAIKLAAPFPPFPANFQIKEINIKGTFEYDIVPGQTGGR